jgi:3-carboxy-cis,cis-muconate cycloisomerase
MAEIAPRLEVDADRMIENLAATRGLIFAEAVSMALAQKIGKAKAHDFVEAASAEVRKSGKHLREVVGGDTTIGQSFSTDELDGFFDARKYLGLAEEFVDRVVAASEQSKVEVHG